MSVIFDYIFKSPYIRGKHVKGINLLQILLSTIVAASYLIIFLLIIYTSLILSLGNIAVYEIIHPFSGKLETGQMIFLVILGVLSGGFHGLGFARGKS